MVEPVKTKPRRVNAPEDLHKVLPKFFKNARVLSSAEAGFTTYRESRAATTDEEVEFDVVVEASPVLWTTQEVREIYTSNDFDRIKSLEEQAQVDLDPIYRNISNNGPKAWLPIEVDDKILYVSYTDSACVWCYVKASDNTKEGEQTYQNLVEYGTYSASTSIAGISAYNLTTPVLIADTALSWAICQGVSKVIGDGMNFAIKSFSRYMVEGLAQIGIRASVRIVSRALAAVTTGLVFAVVFIGLLYLFDWLSRLYTIRLVIYNWSEVDDWLVDGQYMDNAIFPGEEEQNNTELNFTLPKALNSGDIVAPPGFGELETLDSVCYTATVVWENDNTFMEGCAMALRLRRGDEGSNEGFMWAFSCPRFADNDQSADDGLQEPEDYYKSIEWNDNPLGFEIQTTLDHVPVTFFLDALSGNDDNTYTIHMHISQEM